MQLYMLIDWLLQGKKSLESSTCELGSDEHASVPV